MAIEFCLADLILTFGYNRTVKKLHATGKAEISSPLRKEPVPGEGSGTGSSETPGMLIYLIDSMDPGELAHLFFSFVFVNSITFLKAS